MDGILTIQTQFWKLRPIYLHKGLMQTASQITQQIYLQNRLLEQDLAIVGKARQTREAIGGEMMAHMKFENFHPVTVPRVNRPTSKSDSPSVVTLTLSVPRFLPAEGALQNPRSAQPAMTARSSAGSYQHLTRVPETRKTRPNPPQAMTLTYRATSPIEATTELQLV